MSQSRAKRASHPPPPTNRQRHEQPFTIDKNTSSSSSQGTFSKQAALEISVLASRFRPLSMSPARRQNRTNRIEIYLNAYSVVSRNAPPFPSRHADVVERARFGREAFCSDFAHRLERFGLPIDDRRRKPFEYSWARPEEKPHELLQSHPTVSSVSSSRQFIVSRDSLSRKYSSTGLV